MLLIAAAVCAGIYVYKDLQPESGTVYSGLADIVAEGIEVSTNDDLEDSGITGEGLTFDTVYYAYYGMLDTAQQALYAQVCANAEALCDTFAPVTQCTGDDVSAAVEAVLMDHPEYFWLDTSYSYKYTSDGNCVQIVLEFNSLADDIDTAKALFDASANAIIEAASALETDYEKEKYVHDAIITLASYDESAQYHQSAYSALVGGATVCAGYARAFQYIMTRLGIPAYYCTGYSGGDHAWNIVMLGDGYYNVDLTWDDSDPISYKFFNCTDDEFSSTHTRSDISQGLPACTAVLYSGLEESEGEGSYPGTLAAEAETSAAQTPETDIVTESTEPAVAGPADADADADAAADAQTVPEEPSLGDLAQSTMPAAEDEPSGEEFSDPGAPGR